MKNKQKGKKKKQQKQNKKQNKNNKKHQDHTEIGRKEDMGAERNIVISSENIAVLIYERICPHH